MHTFREGRWLWALEWPRQRGRGTQRADDPRCNKTLFGRVVKGAHSQHLSIFHSLWRCIFDRRIKGVCWRSIQEPRIIGGRFHRYSIQAARNLGRAGGNRVWVDGFNGLCGINRLVCGRSFLTTVHGDVFRNCILDGIHTAAIFCNNPVFFRFFSCTVVDFHCKKSNVCECFVLKRENLII